MRYIAVFAGILILVLWSMQRRESEIGVSISDLGVTFPGRYTAQQDTLHHTYTGHPDPYEAVHISIVSRSNSEFMAYLSSPLPLSLSEISGVARYVGMARLGGSPGAEITPEKASLQDISRYNGVGLRWQVGSGRFFYCLPLRRENEPTFIAALLWYSPSPDNRPDAPPTAVR